MTEQRLDLSGRIARLMDVPLPSEREIELQEEARMRQEVAANVAKLESHVGDRYKACRVSNWTANTPKQQEVKQAVREWIETFPERQAAREGMVLYGPVGTGKDHLAFAAVRAVMVRHGVTAKWQNGREFAGEVRDRIDSGGSERELIGKLSGPELLVLSDPIPPVGELSSHQADMLYRVVEARYSAGRLTICTLNVAGESEADDALGAATWDRLCHGAWKIACSWKSHRQPAREIKP